MECTRITQPIFFAGCSAFGTHASFAIIPTDRAGVWWQTASKDTVLINDTTIGVHALFHYLTLRWKNNTLRVPEHLMGLLFAIGLDGAIIASPQSRIPYDGSAQLFWEKIKPEISRGTSPTRAYAPSMAVAATTGQNRFISFRPMREMHGLEYRITVDYQGIGSYTLSGTVEATNTDILANARPWGRTKAHRVMAQLVGIENQYVWFTPTDNTKTIRAKLREIAYHRLFDMLGALEHIRPPHGTLVGKIYSRFAGHATDILLLDEIKRVGLRRVV